ncbi:hypothetical protein D5282_08450 [bacterium 1xD8-48]|jgi:hypothetical protein|nr:hypothetical protein [Lachnospiraceae bacterium]MCI9327349.1 hypothetical protein [Lachnospiraceae bacterium]NBJ97355.1 hypothetical protein [bacterium 1xD8-48]
MARKDDVFKAALSGKRIPVLTLDSKWHQLFTQAKPDRRIRRLEEKLNDLLKRQGKANTEVKEIRKLKKRLMQEIVENAQEASVENDGKAQKKAEDNKRLIGDCNKKIDAYEDELLSLPREIDDVNMDLMLATMDVCYDRLKANEAEITEIARWAAQVKEELKEKLVRKQEMESMNQGLYSYMHDIFGADVIDIFDMKYKKDNGKKD